MFQSVTSARQAVSTISTNISRKLGTSADLEKFALGVTDSYVPNTFTEYQQYRRYLHEILCLAMLAGGYYTSESLTISKLGLSHPDKKLSEQMPDLYTIEGDVIRVCEVSLSFDYESKLEEKNTKYDDLWKFIESNTNYIIQYSPLIIDLTDAEWEDTLVELPEQHMILLRKFISNLILIHATPHGSSYKEQMVMNLNLGFPFTWDRGSLLKDLNNELGTSGTAKEFDVYVEGFGQLQNEQNAVDAYLDKMTDTILTMKPHVRPFPHPGPKEVKELNSEWQDFLAVPSTTKKLPVILQLGSPILTDEVETLTKSDIFNNLKSTNHYGGYLDLIKSSNTTEEEFIEQGIIKLSLTENQLKQEMMDGPGRKKYIKMNELAVEKKPPTHIKPERNHADLVSELIDNYNNIDPQNFMFEQPNVDFRSTGTNLKSILQETQDMLDCNGFSFLLKFYSRLSSEIILNSMKRRKARQYVLAHSGFSDIYFLVAPGPQLRTESNTIFIKILSFVEPLQHILSRVWHLIGDHWESDWISVDSDRLKHWVRAYHRVNLSIVSSAEKLVTPTESIQEALKEEINYGNYGLMALIYLENKSSTSTTIQTTRYVFMKSLGDKQMKGLLSKFPERVSSCLQSIILQRTIEFANNVCSREVSTFINQQSVKRDDNLGILDETTTGVVGRIPRIFTLGNMVPIKYSFNEIYWCMMYNKDRQNKTQDSMKILKKIAKEELKFREELSCRKSNPKKQFAHVFGFHTVEEDIEHILTDKPESHYFSNLAVSIGIMMQDRHPENFAPNSSWMSSKRLHNILNKNLSEYATFKASVNQIVDQIKLDDYDELKKIGKRTKCIELIYDIVENEKLSKACEIAMSFSGVNSSNFKTVIQIFKKNQIGGVREILILYIKARVLINLCEEISRLLSKSDKRETLTKGKDKRLMMRGDYEELTSSFPEGTPLLFVRNSYDMATWCQKFIPTIFLPIYNYHKNKLDNLADFSRFVLMKHCLKEIEYPQKLVEQWMKHKEIIHKELHMQHYKSKFLEDGIPKMINASNMGQGILHYNSTVLALSCQSLRDELFHRCLQKLGKPISIKWKTRVGSDDKGDTIALDMTSDDALYQAKLLEQCSSVSERLHAMELSVKSASGNIIYEFNSAYMANLEVQSPHIKFTLAAVDMIGTTSCTEFVNESYSRIRQLRENGASSLICIMAHRYNKQHFEEIFRTGEHMTNDPRELFSLDESMIPYDFGVYPIYDADIQDMIGPEYHNYIAFTNPRTPEYILRMLYTTNLKFNSDYDFIPNDDEGLFKKHGVDISMGLVRQLENMKDRLNLSKQRVDDYLLEHPFMIIRGPTTPEETSITIASKLYTRGAATSLRRTSPIIYLGRLSAFESARAWKIMVQSEDDETDFKPIKLTYKEFMSKMIEAHKSMPEADSIRKLKPLVFPQHNSFEVVRHYCQQFGLRRMNHKLFSQSIRTWVLNNYNYNFFHSLKSILETSFGMSQEASKWDVEELRKAIPYNVTSYEAFIEDCRSKDVRPLDVFYYLTKFYKNSTLKRAQVFANGPSTSSLNLTLSNIKKYNHLVGSTMEIDFHNDLESMERDNSPNIDFDRLKLAFNMLMLHEQGTLTREDDKQILQPLNEVIFSDGQTLFSICQSIIRNFRSINNFDNQMKKIIIMIASKIFKRQEFTSLLLEWKQLSYTYIRQQRKSPQGEWVGDLSVLVNYSNECYVINKTLGYHYIATNRIENVSEFHQSLMKICKIMNIEPDNFTTISDLKPGDYYRTPKGVYFSRSHTKQKPKLNLQINPRFQYNRIRDLTMFKVITNQKKDGSTTLELKDQDGKSIVITHYPGHYYPVEIPKHVKFNNSIYVNGLRITKLFKQRQWFFNGRLFPFTTKQAINILKYHIKPKDMKKISIDQQTKVMEYIEEYDDKSGLPVDYEGDLIPMVDENKLREDLQKQYHSINTKENFMDIFSAEVHNLTLQGWIEETGKDVDLTNFRDDDEDFCQFVRALGQNRQKAARKDFYTITNLRLNITFQNRIYDLFFRNNSILSEDRSKLPDYAMHVLAIKSSKEFDPDIMDSLFSYVCSRISILTGYPIDKVSKQLIDQTSRRKHYSKLDRLNRLLSMDSPTFYELLGSDLATDQNSDSEDD